MRILLAISILAVVALLWASVSIAQHIRRSRRRSRALHAEDDRMEADLAEISFIALDALAPSRIAPQPSHLKVFSELRPKAAENRSAPAEDRTAQPLPASPSLLEEAARGILQIPSLSPKAVARPIDPGPSSKPAAPPPRPLDMAPPKYPPSSFALPLRRPDWDYFNKDMGDLTDPVARRSRDRDRSRSR